VNDAPSFSIDSDPASVNEDAGPVTLDDFITDIVSGPADEATQTVAFNVTVTGTTGTLAFTTSPTIDSTGKLSYTLAPNTNGTATVTVVMTDSGSSTAPNDNSSDPKTFTITVDAVNDAPSFSIDSDPAAVNEDDSPVTVNEFVTEIVTGPSDESSQTVNFSVTVTGTTGTLAFTTPPAIDSDGNLTYTVAADTNGTATVSVVMTDSGSSAAPNDNSSDPKTFTITVNAVNDAPSFTIAGDPPAVTDDAGDVTENGFAADISPGPNDESTQTLSFTVTVTGSTGDLAFSTAPEISPTGVLTYSVQAGTTGTATVSVILADDGDGTSPNVNVSSAQTFTITVNVAGNPEGEGEAAGTSANDLGLLYYLALSNNADHIAESDQIDDGMWQDAVDEAMAQLS